jgi:hypothetical protein
MLFQDLTIMTKLRLSVIQLIIPVAMYAGQLGVNINFAERGGTFVDIVKEGYRWSTITGEDLTLSQVDSLGWPTVDSRYVVDYRPVAEWSNSIDDPQAYRIDVSGTYKCEFVGKATVWGVSGGTVQNSVYDSIKNRTIFDFTVAGPPGNNHGLLIIEFANTKRTNVSHAGTGITGLRMNRPGYPLSGEKVFTDEFLAALTGIKFSSIRFMNFTMTNGCDPTYPGRIVWEKRKRKNHASQDRIAPLGKTDGGAWEYVIDLCNTVKMDPWINIPVSADSLYIVNVAKLFKENLNQSLHVYVESSNEVWNTAPGFEQSLYSQAEAKALGIGEHENHARRTVQIAKIFSQVYGENSLNNQIRIILCSHKPMLKWWVVPMLSYISKNFGPPKNYLYAVACQTYFGGGTTSGISVDKLLSNCHSEIAGQIDETGGTNEAGRVQWIKVAQDSGLVGGFCSYEGGPDHGGGSTDNIANRITAERDPRMGAIWTYNIDTAFLKIGGNLAMQFTLSSAYTRYGCWGLTDDITKPNRNAKYKAAQDVAAKYASPVTKPEMRSTDSKKHRISVSSSNTTLKIFYNLEKSGDVRIDLWNIKGQRILQQQFNNQVAGSQEFTMGVSGTGMENIRDKFLIATISTDKRTEKCGIVLLRK